MRLFLSWWSCLLFKRLASSMIGSRYSITEHLGRITEMFGILKALGQA
jgi:hypothetical protein